MADNTNPARPDDEPLDLGHLRQALVEERGRIIEELAGDYADTLFSQGNCIDKHLEHPDPQVREAALRLYFELHGVSEATLVLFHRCASHDGDEWVRRYAIRMLGRFGNEPGGYFLPAFLASLVLCETESQALRLEAYRAMILFVGGWHEWSPHPMKLRFPADVDFGFVERYATRPGD